MASFPRIKAEVLPKASKAPDQPFSLIVDVPLQAQVHQAPWYLRVFAQAVPSARKALPFLYSELTLFVPHVDPQTGPAQLLIHSSLFPLGAVSINCIFNSLVNLTNVDYTPTTCQELCLRLRTSQSAKQVPCVKELIPQGAVTGLRHAVCHLSGREELAVPRLPPTLHVRRAGSLPVVSPARSWAPGPGPGT